MQTLAPWLIDLVRETGTPHFIVDLHTVRTQLDAFERLFPRITPFYSTKTCSAPAIIDACLDKGWNFDAATINEIVMLLERGARPEAILYTHPVKTVDEITRAYTLGIRRFTCDCISELVKIAELAPHADIFVRYAPPKDASLYNYRQRLGASLDELHELLQYAVQHKIAIHGISFHVGSQSLKVGPWTKTLRQMRKVLMEFYDLLPSLRCINIGSAFPVQYGFAKTPTLDAVAAVISKELPLFPDDVKFIAEPGRVIAGPSATLIVSVVDRLMRGKTNWLFTDASVYNALIEPLESGGKFRYRTTSSAQSGRQLQYNIAGKTLDPDDIIASGVLLSENLQSGDLLFIHDAGAYTLEFATDYHSLPRPLITFHDSEHDAGVEISEGTAGRGVRAKRDFDTDQVLFAITGHRSKERTRTSFQIAADTHVEPNLYGAYLNHSCSPNAGVRTNAAGTLDIVARQPIKPGEEVTVDYAMFEYEIADMTDLAICQCQSPDCRGTILGYKALPAEKRAAYATYTAAHLRK